MPEASERASRASTSAFTWFVWSENATTRKPALWHPRAKASNAARALSFERKLGSPARNCDVTGAARAARCRAASCAELARARPAASGPLRGERRRDGRRGARESSARDDGERGRRSEWSEGAAFDREDAGSACRSPFFSRKFARPARAPASPGNSRARSSSHPNRIRWFFVLRGGGILERRVHSRSPSGGARAE